MPEDAKVSSSSIGNGDSGINVRTSIQKSRSGAPRFTTVETLPCRQTIANSVCTSRRSHVDINCQFCMYVDSLVAVATLLLSQNEHAALAPAFARESPGIPEELPHNPWLAVARMVSVGANLWNLWTPLRSPLPCRARRRRLQGLGLSGRAS